MSESKPENDAAGRRRRAERLLGGLLPDQTQDETSDNWGDGSDSRDDELQRDVPPHHGA